MVSSESNLANTEYMIYVVISLKREFGIGTS